MEILSNLYKIVNIFINPNNIESSLLYNSFCSFLWLNLLLLSLNRQKFTKKLFKEKLLSIGFGLGLLSNSLASISDSLQYLNSNNINSLQLITEPIKQTLLSISEISIISAFIYNGNKNLKVISRFLKISIVSILTFYIYTMYNWTIDNILIYNLNFNYTNYNLILQLFTCCCFLTCLTYIYNKTFKNKYIIYISLSLLFLNNLLIITNYFIIDLLNLHKIVYILCLLFLGYVYSYKQDKDKCYLISKLKKTNNNLEKTIQKKIDKIDITFNRMSSILNAIHTGIIEIDSRDFSIIDINTYASNLLSMNKSDIINKKCFNILCKNKKCSLNKDWLNSNNKLELIKKLDFINIKTDEIIEVIAFISKIKTERHYNIIINFIDFHSITKLHIQTNRTSDLKTIALKNISTKLGEVITPFPYILDHLSKIKDESTKYYSNINMLNSIFESLTLIIYNLQDDKLLNFGTPKYKPIQINISKLIDTICILKKAEAETKGLNLVYKKPKKQLSWVNVDPVKFSNILNFLLYMSIRYTETGNIIIDIMELTYKKDILYLLIIIKDKGKKFNNTKIKDIILNIELLQNISLDAYSLNMMKGSICINSEDNGNTFIFSSLLNKTVKKEDYDLNKLKKLYILIAEDEPTTKLILKLNLEELGCIVTTVDNGKELLDLIKYNYYDIIISDLRMPVLGGLEAIKHLRNFGYKTPCIAFTANSDIDSVKTYKKVGFNTYLKKPIKLASLTYLLYKYQNDNIFNEKQIFKSYGKKLSLFIEMSEEFKKSFDYNYKNMKKILTYTKFSKDNIEDFETNAHTIKGGAAALFIESIKHIATNIEYIIKNKYIGREEDKKLLNKLISLLTIYYSEHLKYYSSFKKHHNL